MICGLTEKWGTCLIFVQLFEELKQAQERVTLHIPSVVCFVFTLKAEAKCPLG